ncbi:MAG TPA: hypothetical protein VGO27_06125 [Candidatus Acidoferrum sp.]|jgi:hypothetical protein|nr:hypothetical protein [Candidatus Acidoferrum sp.]
MGGSPRGRKLNADNLKPAGSAGVRYTLAKNNHVNLRVDYAIGLDGGGVYMGITEAFQDSFLPPSTLAAGTAPLRTS